MISLFALHALSYTKPINYALSFDGSGILSFGRFQELDDLSKFSIQFWMKAKEWTKGATIFEKGNDIKLILGNEYSLTFKIANNEFEIESHSLRTNAWIHITIMNGDGKLKFLLDNTEIKSFDQSFSFPANDKPLYIGVNYNGLIDELRIWKNLLKGEFDNYWQNTLNEFNPSWSDLVGYWKFDQYTCENIVDYKGNHHGTVSLNGVNREIVEDNDKFKYLLAGAYISFARMAGSALDRDKVRLANFLLVICGKTDANGNAWVDGHNNEAKFQNIDYVKEFKGRNGLAHFNGQGSKMSCGLNPLKTGVFTFGTWIYIDEWTEGSVLIKKQLNDNKGLLVTLGDLNSKTITVHINGHDYVLKNKVNTKQWTFIGFSATPYAESALKQILFVVDDWHGYADEGPSGGIIASLTDFSGMDNIETFIGLDFNGYLDDTCLVQDNFTFARIKAMQNGMQLPEYEKVLDGSKLAKYDSYWKYDNATNLGYDWMSWVEYLRILLEPYQGMRGYTVVLSFQHHANWLNTLRNLELKNKLAKQIAEVANNCDLLSGVDIDFEWAYSTEEWTLYGQFCMAIRSYLKPGKLLTCTPHMYIYQIPVQYHRYIDFFFMQCYGPNNIDVFRNEPYANQYQVLLNFGFPREKLAMSYAATTTGGFKDGQHKPEYPVPSSIRVLWNSSWTRDTNTCPYNGYDFYFNSFNEVYFRSNFIRQHGSPGLMYWDTATDLRTDHPLSVAVASSLAINSNVDYIVDKVDNAPPVPYPTNTPQPTASHHTRTPEPFSPTSTSTSTPDHSAYRTAIIVAASAGGFVLVACVIIVGLSFFFRPKQDPLISTIPSDANKHLMSYT